MQRATFFRSGLVRILSEATPEIADSPYDFGERVGQWLDFSDALALFSVLNKDTGTMAAACAASPAAQALNEQLERTRRQLSEAIANDGVFSGELPRIRFPTPLPQARADSAADFSPYHRYYLAHQRDMNAAIGALRSNARKALAAHSPAHRQLAELDLAFEQSLATRERNLLAIIPMLLAKRFQQRYQDHRATLDDDAIDNPETWTLSGSWLEAFCRDTQAVLNAELQLRLKPVSGLIAALDSTGDTLPNELQ